MRILSKIKLINWHFFINETIPITGDTLITGDNGAGKSTLIDALQVAIVANLKKVRFNSSAMEDRTTRDVRSYLRGKTGTEGKSDYLRNEDFSSYIVLEITNTIINKPYLIGVVFDYFHATGEEDHVFFRIDEEPLHDELFFKAPQELRNRGEFFSYLKARELKHQQYRNDINRYIYDLRQLFGGAKESFFSLFTKGISFTPITNLRSFVYDYILEERTIDVESMRDYFEKFRQVELLINETKNEIAELQKIESQYNEIEKLRETLNINDYMVQRCAWEVKQQELQDKEKTKKETGQEKQKLDGQVSDTERKKQELEQTKNELLEAMQKNEAKQKEKELKWKLEQLRRELDKINELQKNLVYQFRAETQEIGQLQEVLQQLDAPLEQTSPLLEAKEDWSRAASSHGEIFPANLSVPAGAWSKAMNWLTLQKEQWKEKIARLKEEKARLKEIIRDLEQNRVLGTGSATMKLKEVLAENLFDPGGQPVPVHVFCEVIDIRDERWRNAIEGYLHTQKFDLLVPPAYFDEALSLYERYKFTLSIERVGLVNTGRLMEEVRPAQAHSLAEEIDAPVEYVAAYANWLLGAVIKCDSEQELKNFRRAITDTCMLYQNHTARQIPKSRYETPFIGKEAVRTQLQRNRKLLEEVERDHDDLVKKTEVAAGVASFSTDKTDRYSYWEQHRAALQEKGPLETDLMTTQQELLSLDFSEYERLEEEHQKKQAEISNLEKQLQQMARQLGTLETELKNIQEQLEKLDRERTWQEELLRQQEDGLEEDLLEKCRRKWEKESQKQKPETLHHNYSSSREGINTRIGKQMQRLVKIRTDYNNHYNFPGDPEAGDNEEYRSRYRLLADSHLQDYESQAREAREKAEESFQEHFIARLGEYIKLGQEEVKELNRALQGMRFGTDSYRFSLTAKQETKNYYDMIMDSGVYEGSIFRDAFFKIHGDAINDLFREITTGKNEFQETLQSLTDYRTYLDFDIIITDEWGNKSHFSKVARDKSGGETQVPFYVAIMASFYQAYQLYRKTDTLRLVVFDEAFNRMDADRIEEAIRFMQSLGFQAVIVAPTGRIQLIVPHMNTNLVVMKDGFNSFMERVTRKELAG